MFENLINKECEFCVTNCGLECPHLVKGVLQKVYEDFICIKTKKNLQYLAIKYITYVIEL